MATAPVSSVPTPGTSYVEWSAVIAGAVLACAVSLVLLQFGNALGFSIASPYTGVTREKIFIVGLWLLWVQLMASMSGGYLAGRMRAPWASATHESEVRDGAHGLLVWATSSLVTAAAVAIAGLFAVIASYYGPDIATDHSAEISAAVARHYGIVFGFGLTASSIVSAVAAWWMGTLGGDHRDRTPDFTRFSFRKAHK